MLRSGADWPGIGSASTASPICCGGGVRVLSCAHRFGWSPLEMGIAILASGLAGVGVQAWRVERVVKAVGGRGAVRMDIAA